MKTMKHYNRNFYISLSALVVLLAGTVIYFNRTAHLHSESNVVGSQFEKKPDGFRDYYRDITVPFGASESGYSPGYRMSELKKLKESSATYKKSFSDTLIWIERGPGNVGGRTRSVVVDPDDETYKTWYAGSVSGGVWKTTDGGKSWVDLTPELPNLSTVSLCMAPSNHDVIYIGTGEGFGNVGGVMGDGIFYSTDRGRSWNQISSTVGNPDFSYVNKMWVDPEDDKIIIVATNTGVFKTVDRGEQWRKVYSSRYRVQDLRQNPSNPNTLYAGVNTTGIIKSVDRGEHWEISSNGIGNGLRFSIAVSTIDTAIIFTSVETPEATLDIYYSDDAAANWRKHKPIDDNFMNFHSAQGWYNNAIVAHPSDSNKVFVGGVYIGVISFEDEISESAPKVTRVDTSGTSAFIDFINFGANYLGGGMSTGLDEGAAVSTSDFVSVEIRFGPGRGQKAHLFRVPEGQGPGVPSTDYTYVDYVDVPFEVWDITNNRQLMVSFRDQERDGAFNLILRDPDDEISGREYLFVSAFDYDPESPHPEIVNAEKENKGGHYNKLLYFFWPTLAEGGEWDPLNLTVSEIYIEFGTQILQGVTTQIISSDVKNTELHVDHHDLIIIPAKFWYEDFQIISGNDGGIGYSWNSGKGWKQLSNEYNTSQFYGVSKKPGEDEFIGGLQDNGTYQSPSERSVTKETSYLKRLGGDGFQTLWHPNGRSILASIYNNRFYRSSNGGVDWSEADNGLEDDGPFISKLSFNRNNPDVVFTIGAKGIYKHTSFGSSQRNWEQTPIDNKLVLYGSASSSLNVKVSRANPSIVWAGSGMYTDPDLRIFVSTDQGVTFNPTSIYPDVELGYLSGMETHPIESETAFLLFSYKGKAKILRTEDLGATWTDISGFGSNSVSSSGFPDVAVLSLLVMPHDPEVIWAGTEIGIVESTDRGASWHLLNSDFPNVSVFQLDFQDGQIIIATHGRGIWTAGNFQVGVKEANHPDFTMKIFPNPATDYLFVQFDSGMDEVRKIRLVDMTGRQIADKDIDPLSAGRVVQLDIADASPGNYILEIWRGNRVHGEQVVVY